MRLSDYLDREKLSYAAFGRIVELPRVTVRQYALGLRTQIAPDAVRKIAEATKGEVTANDFYGVEAAE